MATVLPPGLAVLAPDIFAYHRLLSQLLADGHEGRYALVVGETLRGVYDIDDDAYEAGLALAGVGRPFLAQRIDARDIGRLAQYVPAPDAVPA